MSVYISVVCVLTCVYRRTIEDTVQLATSTRAADVTSQANIDLVLSGIMKKAAAIAHREGKAAGASYMYGLLCSSVVFFSISFFFCLNDLVVIFLTFLRSYATILVSFGSMLLLFRRVAFSVVKR